MYDKINVCVHVHVCVWRGKPLFNHQSLHACLSLIHGSYWKDKLNVVCNKATGFPESPENHHHDKKWPCEHVCVCVCVRGVSFMIVYKLCDTMYHIYSNRSRTPSSSQMHVYMYRIYLNRSHTTNSSRMHVWTQLSGCGYSHKWCTIVLLGQKHGKGQAWIGSVVEWKLTFRSHLEYSCHKPVYCFSTTPCDIRPKLIKATLKLGWN